MVERGQDLLASRRGLDERLGELGGAMNVVQLVAGESGLPGFPRAIATGNPKVDGLLRHMVVDADKGVLLRDRGLADLLGKQAGHVNQYVDRFRLADTQLLQYVDIDVDNYPTGAQSRTQKRGPENKFYQENQVQLFLEKSSDAYLPAPREELKRVVAAFPARLSAPAGAPGRGGPVRPPAPAPPPSRGGSAWSPHPPRPRPLKGGLSGPALRRASWLRAMTDLRAHEG